MNGHETDGVAASRPTGRALMVVPQPARSAENDRRQAGFVTQLYASERRFAAYRVANRERPEVAHSAYTRRPAPLEATTDVAV